MIGYRFKTKAEACATWAGKRFVFKCVPDRQRSVKKQLLKTSHVKRLRYFSMDTSVATVTGSGTIKAKNKGTCTVYAVAANGAKAAIKVTVK